MFEEDKAGMKICDSFFIGSNFNRCQKLLYNNYIAGKDYFDDSINFDNCDNYDENREDECCCKYADLICEDKLLGKFLDLAYDKDVLERELYHRRIKEINDV